MIQARILGQLGPLKSLLLEENNYRGLVDFLSQSNQCALGDVKVPALFGKDEWAAYYAELEIS